MALVSGGPDCGKSPIMKVWELVTILVTIVASLGEGGSTSDRARAERRLGEMMAEQPKAQGTRAYADGMSAARGVRPTSGRWTAIHLLTPGRHQAGGNPAAQRAPDYHRQIH